MIMMMMMMMMVMLMLMMWMLWRRRKMTRLRWMMLRRKINPKIGRHTLCEPAQSKCT